MNMHVHQPYRHLAELMERYTGQQLLSNRHWRIEMALKPVLRKHSIPDLGVLVSLLDGKMDSVLARDCVEAMLNNETCFFRDQANFALLTGPVTDAIREKRAATKRLRIWSVACSTGQEPYSLAIAIKENEAKWRDWNVSIIGTDVSRTALEQARTGRFSQFEIQRGLPVTMMLKYFEQQDEDWQLSDDIRNMVTFREHNQMDSSAHFGTFDIILCRNMMMYLSDQKKTDILKNLRQSISEDGYLMLGAAETVIGHTTLFKTSQEFRGLYETTLQDNVSQGMSGL